MLLLSWVLVAAVAVAVAVAIALALAIAIAVAATLIVAAVIVVDVVVFCCTCCQWRNSELLNLILSCLFSVLSLILVVKKSTALQIMFESRRIKIEQSTM